MGDVEKGFQEADIITEGTFGYENIPNPLPPEGSRGNSPVGGTEQGDALGVQSGFIHGQDHPLPCDGEESRSKKHRRSLWRQLRVKVHVLAGSVLCSAPEQGNGQAGKTHLHQGRTPGGIHDADLHRV